MTKRIFYMLYPPFILFLIYTFANRLLRELFHNISVEMLLYILLWLFLTIQAIFAYIRIKNTPNKKYTLKALISDCVDILIAIYVCAAIGGIGKSEYCEMNTYLHLSIPFIILSVNQFCWFIIIRDFDIPAVFRISILFIGMFAVSISELICHNFWNLVALVALIVLLGILRAIDKAPDGFSKVVTKLWNYVKINKL